jgi:hypothetical protein
VRKVKNPSIRRYFTMAECMD